MGFAGLFIQEQCLRWQRMKLCGAVCRVEDVEKLEKSPLIAKNIPIFGVIYHTEVRHNVALCCERNKS